MKKYFILAVAAVAMMASCTKTESINSQKDGFIDFGVFMHKSTKATLTDVKSLDQFTVTAIDVNSTKYINAQTVAVADDGTCSDYGTYYWPTDDSSLDFFCWGPSANAAGITANEYNLFTLAPATDPVDQVDFVVARTQGKKSTHATTGVVCNFRHAMSQVALKVFNGNKDLEYDVYGWKVINIDMAANYTLADANTDTKNSAKISYDNWTNNTDALTAGCIDDFDEFTNIYSDANQTKDNAGELTGATNMVLIPQLTLPMAGDDDAKNNVYAGNETTSGIKCSYIAVLMTIKNHTNDAVVANTQWCCWPVQFDWKPGYKYTYIIDLAEGGYKELNDGATAEAQGGRDVTSLDPILENAKITFATVTVDDWTDADAEVIAM